MAFLPADCSRIGYDLCSLKDGYTLEQVRNTVITFKLSDTGIPLKIPLVKFLNADLKFLIVPRITYSSYTMDSNSILSDFEIVFGTTILESLYVIFDVREDRMALANKLYNDSVNTGKEGGIVVADHLCRRLGFTVSLSNDRYLSRWNRIQ